MAFSSLACHHPSGARPPLAIAALAERGADGAVRFRYRVQGDVRRIRLPPPGAAARADGLWRHTCFEAFVRPYGSDRYLELNFSPAGAWAAYSFERYRVRLEAPPSVDTPRIRVRVDDDSLSLDATVQLPPLCRDSAVGLAAVIEDSDGNLSYWALAHPCAQPDFHDAAAWTGTFERLTGEERQ